MASVGRKKRRDGTFYAEWYAYWRDEHGHRRSQRAYTDKTTSLQLATRNESEAAQVRDGLVSRPELKQREASRKALKDHVEDYRRHLIAKGGTEKHARHTRGAIARLLADAVISRLSDFRADRVQEALARLKVACSPRTANHARGAIRAFGAWLADGDRIERNPFRKLSAFSEEEGRKFERRALSAEEIGRLIAAAESGPPVKLSRRGYQYEERWITGPERAMLYRLAMETGFRANELRSLTMDSFRLDDSPPAIVCAAAYTKNGRRAVQPVRAEFAADLRRWLPSRPASGPVLPVPEKTAQLLRRDLEAAGIPYEAKGLVVDFHSLRGTFITNLIRAGANPKAVQKLARHSTITLTLDKYTHLDTEDLQAALAKSVGGNDEPKGI